MRKTPVLLVLVAASLAGCPTNNTNRDSGVTPGNDANVDAFVVPGQDTGVGMDAGGGPATDVPIASVVNASATDHPADGTQIHVTGNLVALTRRYVSGPSASSMRCLASIWVGTLAGGDYSSIQVIDSYPVDTSGDCFMTPPHNIPSTINIGDAVTNLVGQFQNFCPSGMSCPPNTAQEIAVTNGTFTAGAAMGTPMATTATITEVAGSGLTFGSRDMALQNALVRITGTVLVTPPDATTHVMTVAATGTTTPVMQVRLANYSGVTCQRAELATAGATVGDITGILSYSFGNWQLSPTQASDLPGVPCTMDAGIVDAGM